MACDPVYDPAQRGACARTAKAAGCGVVDDPPARAPDALAKRPPDRLHPVGRVGEIEDVVAGVLYLESAPFVTGEILHIDGGQSAGH
jgi:NAD(P)-dependent dehydrogenase (short-subunit alcohol dehydrogenase family)